jgi:hypothetical protein
MFFNTYISVSPKNTELFFLSSEALSGHMNGACTVHSLFNKMINKYYVKALCHVFFLEGQCHKIFASGFFHESVSLQPQSNPLEPFQIFCRNSLSFAAQGAPPAGINDAG